VYFFQFILGRPRFFWNTGGMPDMQCVLVSTFVHVQTIKDILFGSSISWPVRLLTSSFVVSSLEHISIPKIFLRYL